LGDRRKKVGRFLTALDDSRVRDAGDPTMPPLLSLIRELPRNLLATALTHSSWVAERTSSNERLEFLGDSVLGLSVAVDLYERFPDESEGELARWKAYIVSRASCALVARRLGLDELVMTSAPGDEDQRAELAAAPTALGNLLEALIGACYLAHGFAATQAAVVDAFHDQVAYAVTGHTDYKSTLQEHLAGTGGRTVSYEVVGEEGPPHERVFRARVLVDGRSFGEGTGRSIKKSEQWAAKEALVRLGVISRATPDPRDDDSGDNDPDDNGPDDEATARAAVADIE
jgi:ribonuclease-3